MRCHLLLLFALASPAGAGHAREEVAGTLKGGLGAVWREPSDAPPFDILKLGYDTGTLAWIESSSHYDYGLLVRASYAYSYFDGLYGLGNLMIEEDIQQHDARLGAFYAPAPDKPLSGRVGAGYVFTMESSQTGNTEGDRSQDGGFAEAGLAWRISRGFTLDAAVAGVKLDGDGDYDADGTELRLAAAWRVGALDLVVGGRYADVQRESPFDEEVLELRLGLGGAWGWTENAR